MLTEQAARQLGFTGDFSHYKISKISFVSRGTLWNKGRSNLHAQKQKSQRHAFTKFGKTFGMETTRYISYKDGWLFYYDDELDKQCKGYMSLDNLYVYYLPIKDKFMMYLTNGNEFTSFYFKDNSFLKETHQRLTKDVIQFNFKDKYEMGAMLGQGTFSKVFLATRNDKKYAIKVVPKIDNTGFITKNIVMEQKKILKCLNSDKVCKMEQFYEDSGNYIIVLEYLTGKDLNCIFKNCHKLSIHETKYIIRDTLLSLEELHKKNIIHRDLKPHNIVVDLQKKQVKLIDFGLSLIYDNSTDISKFMRCGTMGYIAPEVVNNGEGNRKRYDTKSDMFGFGIIAHMLLMGTNPLRAKTYKGTVQKNIKGDAELNRQMIQKKYGAKCYNFLSGLLQKQPHKRISVFEALKHPFLIEGSNLINPQNSQQESVTYKNVQINYSEDKQFVTGNSRILTDSRDIKNYKLQPTHQTVHSLKNSSMKLGIH